MPFFSVCRTSSCQIFDGPGIIFLNTRFAISAINGIAGALFFLIFRIYLQRMNESGRRENRNPHHHKPMVWNSSWPDSFGFVKLILISENSHDFCSNFIGSFILIFPILCCILYLSCKFWFLALKSSVSVASGQRFQDPALAYLNLARALLSPAPA